MSFTLPTDIENRPVTVIGAGTLGRRIALMFADRGGLARIYDKSAQAGDAARAYVQECLPKVAAGIEGGRPGRVEVTDDMAAALADAWLVVEAVPERLDLKMEIFGELDRTAPADAILASNSSSYASGEFIDRVEHPERVLNIHFYMPPVQNAVDLMSDGWTDPGIMELLKKELPRYGVFPFEAHKKSTGFIFNRIWAAIKREALSVVAEGVSTPQDVDEMWKINTGAPAGPFRMMDRVGLDVVLDIEEHYAAENPHLPAGPRKLLKKYVAAGHLGVKTGQGFYTYDGQG
ncbi:3-hydroxyacyl-CoA dehydrogenase family protein [Streptomyces sp. NEAU-sy36]|uniref:3-hydroxyacyl-CoA dehydrogenase family protein n=1 Tax=unclassified Streptomyces TaxID=2593676 RepID=UPI0015D58875|nr:MULTISPECIES: 3-hydroxyacyl-CoA dehydrogenase NAD-binding domain-containing protein [unclassified Streptomyces]QLJ02915.1 3-hydroxyacyl-CoA dehydrogenase family protein [Streptomyces sp. NEAU-sy36]